VLLAGCVVDRIDCLPATFTKYFFAKSTSRQFVHTITIQIQKPPQNQTSINSISSASVASYY
jgi:hypothetical protein